jgi:2-dehydro-3-deoxyphosphooctonate aldolase (KDO 8-P synthase)
MQDVQIGQLTVGAEQPLLIIAGPCLIESTDQCLCIAQTMSDLCRRYGMNYIFKASFDKANRSSIHSRRGPGLTEGLITMEKVHRECGVPTTTDIHEPQQAKVAGEVVDVLQIPAFLCRQTDLLLAAAQTGKVVNVKKGQFMSPAEMTNVVTKLHESSAQGIMLTERGTFFGYHRLVNDFVGLGDLMELGWPVCFDVTHSTQLPGGEAMQSGGRPERGALLARAAVAAGVQALFIETHPDPSTAASDAATMLPLDEMDALLAGLARLYDAR